MTTLHTHIAQHADASWQAAAVRNAIRMYAQFRANSAAPRQWDIWLADRLALVTDMTERNELVSSRD